MSGQQRRFREKASHPIPVWNGLFEHRKRIDSAIWVFLWLLDAITEEKDGLGLVHGGAPVRSSTIASELKFDLWTVRHHLKELERAKYISRRRTPYGHVIEVLNSRKFGIWHWHKRAGENPHSEPERVGDFPSQSEGKPLQRVGVFPRYKEDAAVDAAITQQPATALAPKPEDSVWSLLEIKPCGPPSFRSLLEAGWMNRSGGPYSTLIGDTLDAWEATEGRKPGYCAPLFRALSKLRESEKQNSKAATPSEAIHAFLPEEIPA